MQTVNQIKVHHKIKNKSKTSQLEIECPKCNGTGHIPAYSHIHGGVCFRCDGRGKVHANTSDFQSDLYLDFAVISTGQKMVYDSKGRTKEVVSLGYVVRCSYLYEYGKGNVDCKAHWWHFKVFQDRKEAHKLLDKIEAANLTAEHLEDSPHWDRRW